MRLPLFHVRESRRLARVYLIEGIGSFASSLMTISIFFYTRSRLDFSTRQNLIFSAVLGVVYVISALSSHRLAECLGARRTLLGAFSISGLLALIPLIAHSAIAVCLAVLAFVLCITVGWPILEHLVSAGDIDGKTLTRRITLYNLTWSSTGALAIALGGTVIDYFPTGMFLLPAGFCAICALLAGFTRIEPDADSSGHAILEPDPQLLRQGRLAVTLARISMPAMYVVTYALAAMTPSLRVLQVYGTASQTLISSLWFAVRVLTFLVLGLTTFWTTRPRLLLVAGTAQLLAFILIVVPFSSDHATNLSIMFVGQVILGIATGLIYMSSLYFGMALTQGSAESGGYHEALIGVGMTIGPAAGATMEFISPHNQPAAVAAVSTILGLTVVTASVMSLRIRRANREVVC